MTDQKQVADDTLHVGRGRMALVANTIGEWNGEDYDDWWERFDGIARAFSLNGQERYEALIKGLGFQRAGDILHMAQLALKTVKTEEGKESEWLERYLKQRFGKEVTHFEVLQKLWSRRLERDESINDYWSDKLRLYLDHRVSLAPSDAQKTFGEDDPYFLDLVIAGLPKHFQQQTKQKFSERGTTFTSKQVLTFLQQIRREPGAGNFTDLTKNKPNSPAKQGKTFTSPKKEFKSTTQTGTPKKPQTPVSTMKTLRCYLCKQEGHKATQCPKRFGYADEQEKVPSTHGMKLRGKEKNVTVVTDENSMILAIQNGQLRFVDLELNGKTVRCLVDTGASYSILDRAVARVVAPMGRKSTIKTLKSASGPVDVYCEVTVQTNLENDKLFRFLVVDNFICHGLIGEDFLSEFSVDVLHSTNELKIGEKTLKMKNLAGESILETLKKCLTTNPILQLPDSNKPFIIRTDASGFAIGAMLAQKHDRKIHPVAYWSRKLMTAEKNYTTTEREGLAVVEAIRKWKNYVEGTNFTVETDHMALKSLMQTKDPSARLARWIAELQRYEFQIIHRPGREIGMPDVLSRDSNLMVMLKDDEKLADLQRKDPELVKYFDYLEKKKLPDDSSKAKEVVAQAYHLAIDDGVLVHVRVPHGSSRKRHLQRRLVIPQSLRQRVLEECHDVPTAGHLGFERTYTRIQERYWWPDCWKETKDYVTKCERCALSKRGTKKSNGEIIPVVVGSPWQQVGVDFLGPLPKTKKGNQYILVFCDYFTRWAIAIPTKGPTAEETCDAIIKEVYTKFGAPAKLISDNGAAFTASLTKKICEKLNIEKIFTTPYHPQANGLVEQWNSTVLGMLRTLVDAHVGDWEDYLDFATFAYNTSKHSAIGYSPFFMNFGRDPLIPLDVVLNRTVEDSNVDVHVQQRLDLLDQSIKEGRDAQEKAKRKAHVDRVLSDAPFKVGDLVLVNKPSSKKLEEKWEGPFEVKKVDGSTITVQYYGSSKQFHFSRVKRSTITPISLDDEPPKPPTPPEVVEVNPDPKMHPKDLIGKRVRVWWPSLKLWFDGTVMSRRGKRHVVRYDVRSEDLPDDEEEEFAEFLLGSKRPAKWKLLVPAASN